MSDLLDPAIHAQSAEMQDCMVLFLSKLTIEVPSLANIRASIRGKTGGLPLTLKDLA
jgi:hypothetical protein